MQVKIDRCISGVSGYLNLSFVVSPLSQGNEIIGAESLLSFLSGHLAKTDASLMYSQKCNIIFCMS